MMKWTRYWLLMPVLLVQALSSCSLIDEPEYDDSVSVNASLAFTVSSDKKNSTRMTDVVVQETGTDFRGLDIVSMIPFAIPGETFVAHGQKIVNTDEPTLLLDDASRVDGTKNTYYFYQSYTMVRGVNAFLVYGKAGTTNMSVPDGVSEKAYFGSLRFMRKESTTLELLSNLTTPNLQKLRFTLDPIYPSATVPAEAGLLAGYLSYIAQTLGWNPTNKSYMFFTGLQNEGNMVMAGSSAGVVAHVNALYNMIKSETNSLYTDIINRIQNPDPSLNIRLKTTGTDDSWELTAIQKKVDENTYVDIEYPSSVGLPDGAAALRWAKKSGSSSEYEFKPSIETTALDNINNIGRFCYPAELFYYANSRINTSNWIIGSDVYNAESWDAVCEKYQYKPGTVTNSTKSVVICDPLQYAVGRLKISMKAETTTGTLKDSEDKDVTLTNTSFPLTGVIVCNQHPVDFNFKPVLEASGASSHVFDSFIYDSQVKNGNNEYYCLTTSEQNIPSTLVLQTYDTGEGNDMKGAEDVTIVMEFQNNSDQTFSGKDCVIYPGTKFYMIGKIKPSETTSTNEPAEAKGRVFTQDHVTTVNTKVSSLANAYNVLPDLIGGRLELGVELVSGWVQAETTNVILK